VALLIKRANDLIEAHEITYERQILAIAYLLRVCEGSSNDVAKFGDVAHVKATHSWINRKGPSRRSVRLLVQNRGAHNPVIIHGRDDEGMIHKPCFLNNPINVGLAGKVGGVELTAADGFYIRQR
jgi:hypothetical protein